MLYGGSKRSYLNMAAPDTATTAFKDAWTRVYEQFTLDGKAVPADGLEARSFQEEGYIVTIIQFPPGAGMNEPVYAASVVGPCHDINLQSDAVEQLPVRYFVGVIAGEKLAIVEVVDEGLIDQEVSLEIDPFIFVDWVRSTIITGVGITSVPNTDTSMDEAIAQARLELPAITERFLRGELEAFTVKVKIVDDDDQTEHMWLSKPSYANGKFTGTFESEPRNVTNITVGQTYSASLAEITDWMYMKNGQMVGNYTLRAMLPRMAPEQANKIRARLAGLEPHPAPKPIATNNESSMTAEGRQALRTNVVSFLNSRKFNAYAAKVYPAKVRGTNQTMQSALLDVAHQGKVEMAYIVMANSQLTRGKIDHAPALLIAGTGGDDASEQHTQQIMLKIANEDYDDLPAADVKQLQDMLADEQFQLFRMRALPASLTQGKPVYFFDVMLTADCLMQGGDSPQPICPCIVAPESDAKIFPIPLNAMSEDEPTASTPPPIPLQNEKAPASATFALIFGIASWILFPLFAIPALLCGHQARSKIKQGLFTKGGTRALIGLILGYLMLASFVGIIIYGITGNN
ncbi:Unannotated [Lentimonas sp. CC4]|nr:Unannotated [Lentimonas sp. CC4]CAA6686598.1 Unannotated [Lentimonas sp. CC6]CAA7074874.1 Unannotated [Lentimonas sp. CC4]CAA7169500.1 Unannotated [Lentimonas sp. CC21]CAA7179772.1 Unannotated [Lentimonas sp. CC8]